MLAALLCVLPLAAHAVYVQPAALANSGPVRVEVDTELGAASNLLKPDALKAHIAGNLDAAGVATVDGNLPAVVTPGEQMPATLRANIAAEAMTSQRQTRGRWIPS
jgi:hypothetical protein